MTEQTQPTDAPLDVIDLMRVVMDADNETRGFALRGTTNWAAHIGKAVQNAVLAKWGTPAGAGEPFGHWFCDDPKDYATPGSGFKLGKEPPVNAVNVVALYTTPQPTQAQAVVEVPAPQQELVGDASMAHEQCRAVVHLALMLAEVYAANAAIVAHAPNLADQIGYASAQALEWIGDELNATDATAEDDEWVDPIIEAAQERWPTTQHVAVPLTEREMAEGWRKFQEDLEARMAADPAGVRSMGREHWLSWAHWKAACYFARSHKGADHGQAT